MIVDSHCHLADQAFSADREAVIARAREAGVTDALCILAADDPEELDRASRDLSRLWPGLRYATAVHPHGAGAYEGQPERAAAVTREAAARTSAAALGEMGLDYHYTFAPRSTQQAVFAAQVALAVEIGRPVVIHTREAADDTVAVLREAGRGEVRGVMHCFTGTREEARQALDLGFWISLSGILTFPRAEDLREVAAFVPVDRLLVETDAPYLAPVPHRGKRNEPAWVVETLGMLSRIHGLTPEAMATELQVNFRAFLGEASAVGTRGSGLVPR